MSMICPSCHTVNRDDAKFCKKCRYDFHTHPEAAKVPEAAMVNQTSTPAPAQEGVIANEDISQAPTQIISPQQMMAFHANRWQKDLEQEHDSSPGTPEEQPAGNGTELPAQLPTPTPPVVPTPAVQNESQPPEASQPTGQAEPMPPSGEGEQEAIPIPPPPPPITGEATPIPPPPPPDAGASNPYLAETIYSPVEKTVYASAETPANAEKDEDSASGNDVNEVQDKHRAANGPHASGDGQTSGTSENEVEGATILPTNAGAGAGTPPSSPSSTNSDFPLLPVGTTVAGRYEITGVVSDDAPVHLYDVTDHQGYQRCWNCSSEQNSEGDEFCIDCGAELLNAVYTMHEYPPNSGGEDASMLHGIIVNTFVDQGKTYVIVQAQASEDAFPNGVHLLAASDSDAGNVRRSDPNEDSTLMLMLQRVHESQSAPAGVFIVADGMGGHDNGQGASRLAISTITERMVRELLLAPLTAEQKGEAVKPLDEDTLVSLLQGAVEDANAAICKVNQHDKSDMGSTITGFMIYKDYAYILNVGDSRTYMVRGGQIYQLTTDHSLVGQLVAGGLIQPDDVYTHPQRSQIFRSLGDKLNVQIDIFKQQLHPGDILLACCDGLWEMVRNPQIESILNKAPDPQMACSQLIEAANANGGEDNISAVVVFVH